MCACLVPLVQTVCRTACVLVHTESQMNQYLIYHMSCQCDNLNNCVRGRAKKSEAHKASSLIVEELDAIAMAPVPCKEAARGQTPLKLYGSDSLCHGSNSDNNDMQIKY